MEWDYAVLGSMRTKTVTSQGLQSKLDRPVGCKQRQVHKETGKVRNATSSEHPQPDISSRFSHRHYNKGDF